MTHKPKRHRLIVEITDVSGTLGAQRVRILTGDTLLTGLLNFRNSKNRLADLKLMAVRTMRRKA